MPDYKTYLGDTPLVTAKVGTFGVRVPYFETTFVDYAIVAGGGGGSIGSGAGGGGEVKTNFFTGSQLPLIPGTVYNIVIGDGGSGSVYYPGIDDGGQNGYPSYISSSFDELILYTEGGGGGAIDQNPFSTLPYAPYDLTASAAKDGGSGGGGSFYATISTATDGGYGNGSGAGAGNAAGGGGGSLTTGSDGYSQSIGQNEWLTIGGNGGEPLIIDWIPFNNGELGAGGGAGQIYSGEGGALPSVTTGSAGYGGGTTGGNGGVAIERPQPITLATSGSTNTGAGGGGGGSINSDVQGRSYQLVSGWGGSGFASIRYTSSTPLWSGGEISSSGGYIYHFFTASADLSYIG